MTQTLQNVADRARLVLNDPTQVTYPDSTHILPRLQDGIWAMYSLRPDLFRGAHATLDPYSLGLSDDVPFPPQFCSMLGAWVIFSAQMTDDEFVVEGRAKLALDFFTKGLTT